MIDKLPEDLAVEEIHKIRRAIHDRFGGDVQAILVDARNRQLQSNNPVWRGAAAIAPGKENEVERRRLPEPD